MKILLIVIGFLFITTFSSGQNSPEPITKFLKLKWEVEIGTKNTFPAISDQYLLTADNFAIDARTGEKINFPLNMSVNRDSLLIHSTEAQLIVTNINSNEQQLKDLRRRVFYVGQNELVLSSDSISVEVIVDVKDVIVQATNLYTKEIIWTVQSDSKIFDSPLIRGDKVFIVNRKEILVLDKHDGTINDNFSTGGTVLSGLVLFDNVLYMIVKDKGLVAFDLDKKEIIWEFSLQRYSGHVNKIVIDNDLLYFSDSKLYALNRNDGKLIWKVGVDKGIFIRRPDHLSKVKDNLIFYVFEENENLLTVVDKNTGETLYQGVNSNVVGSDSNNPYRMAKADLLLISFMDELIDGNILIGVMDDKIYGFEVLK